MTQPSAPTHVPVRLPTAQAKAGKRSTADAPLQAAGSTKAPKVRMGHGAAGIVHPFFSELFFNMNKLEVTFPE